MESLAAGTGKTVAAYQYVTFLTDFGLEDGFVAACHGVVAKISPQSRIIDISHLIPPGDVRRGAAVLAQTVLYLPPAVHVAVVDPGVGTARRPVAIEAGDRIFVGPDNGLLSWAAHKVGGARRAFELSNPKLWLEPVSTTFHGRDVFSPVAAQLAGGLDITQVGGGIGLDELSTLALPVHHYGQDEIEGEVLTIDRFGNVQLSVTAQDLNRLGVRTGSLIEATLGRQRFTIPYREAYGAVPPGDLVVYPDSAGYIAIAVNYGDASQRLALPPGSRVRIAAGPSPDRHEEHGGHDRLI